MGKEMKIKSCSICRKGIVLKLEHVYECDTCGAIGDFYTGIMEKQATLEK